MESSLASFRGTFIYSNKYWVITDGPKIYEGANRRLVRKLRNSDCYNCYSYTKEGERCNSAPCDYILRYEIMDDRIAKFALDSPLKPYSYIGIAFTRNTEKPLDEMTMLICAHLKEDKMRVESYPSINDEIFLDKKKFTNHQFDVLVNKRMIFTFDVSLNSKSGYVGSHSLIYFLYFWGEVDNSTFKVILPKKEKVGKLFENFVTCKFPRNLSNYSVDSQNLLTCYLWIVLFVYFTNF
ncbi:uncharacterized protein [Centruroides vittatus]|uniref:uncharacterized protein isoform X2 n=1 Tax=Centruroides vittatus TaxID=120091 RepID=UPI00350FCD36